MIGGYKGSTNPYGGNAAYIYQTVSSYFRSRVISIIKKGSRYRVSH
jgi:hypothetical protein